MTTSGIFLSPVETTLSRRGIPEPVLRRDGWIVVPNSGEMSAFFREELA